MTSSCSCLMSLTLSKQLHRVYEEKPQDSARRAFQRIFNASWRSSGLGLNNAFSTVLVIGAFGLLVASWRHGCDIRSYHEEDIHTGRQGHTWPTSPRGWRATSSDSALITILLLLPSSIGSLTELIAARFCFNRPSGALFCHWARQQFNSQRSLVVAQHESLMDPVAMAMAACLCARLRKIADAAQSQSLNKCLQLLPSEIELQHGMSLFFDETKPFRHLAEVFSALSLPEGRLELLLHLRNIGSGAR